MSRIKLLVSSAVSVLAVLAVSAASASTASAAFALTSTKCVKDNEVFINFCYATAENGELFELTGKEATEALLDEGESTLEFKSGTTTSEISCTGSQANFEVENLPLVGDYPVLPFKIKFTGCAILGAIAPKCEVSATLETLNILGVAETDEEPPLLSEEAVTFSPQGNLFIEIGIKDKGTENCILKGITLKVSGKQQCLWIHPKIVELGHLLMCLGTESLLKAAGIEAKFSADYLVLMPILEVEDWWSTDED